MGIDTEVTLGTAGTVGMAVVCVFGVSGVAGATGMGCADGAGLAGAGCRMEPQSGRNLQCGHCGIWNSVSRLDAAFMWVSSHAVVNSTIARAYLVAVLG